MKQMKVIQCDICGKIIKSWYGVIVKPAAINPMFHGDMMQHAGDFDICQQCLEKIEKYVKPEGYADGV